MAEDDQGKSGVTNNLRESYQPKAEKTYSPTTSRGRAFDSYTPNVNVGGNYQPIIPITQSAAQPAPPTGGSGVPPSRTNGNSESAGASGTPNKSNGS